MSERWKIEPEYTMMIDSSLGILGVLPELTTVVTKAGEVGDSDRSARSGVRTLSLKGARDLLACSHRPKGCWSAS